MKKLLTHAFATLALIGAAFGISRPAQAQSHGLAVVVHGVSLTSVFSHDRHVNQRFTGVGFEYRTSPNGYFSLDILRFRTRNNETKLGLRGGVGLETNGGIAGGGAGLGILLSDADMSLQFAATGRLGTRDGLSLKGAFDTCFDDGCNVPSLTTASVRSPSFAKKAPSPRG